MAHAKSATGIGHIEEIDMPDDRDIDLISHLMRRAGFGATHNELVELAALGYEKTVTELLKSDTGPGIDEALLFRYLPRTEAISMAQHAQTNWLYRMANSKNPLHEKMALFWHHVFATGIDKVTEANAMDRQIAMFREYGMGNYRDLLAHLAQDPGMIFWLDNQDNHKRAPNENWGRELLELFSLGVGQYTEKDVYECARAFTGWTYRGKRRGIQFAGLNWEFEYRAEDHDEEEKTFLGHTGNFNGQEIIDIVVQQPACARFIMRHLYSFFVEDEPEVPKWPHEPPRNAEAIETLTQVFIESGLEMRPVLSTLFNSPWFKESLYLKVKNPVEVVISTLKLTEALADPSPIWDHVAAEPGKMGQDVLNPPSVEGWHTGSEWISSGALINRVNFVADHLKETTNPGIRAMIQRIGTNCNGGTATKLVDYCLKEMRVGPVEDETYQELVSHANSGGPVTYSENGQAEVFAHRVGEILALIAGTKEYQFG